jgi:hypothetical protein
VRFLIISWVRKGTIAEQLPCSIDI